MIFIAGNSRSGTTMLGRILGNHHDIFTFHELHFLEETWMPVTSDSICSGSEAINNLANLFSIERDGYLKKRRAEKYTEEATACFKALEKEKISYAFLYQSFLKYETEKNQKKIACEKTPRNILYIKELLDIYPQCKIICMIRDPKDVLLSQKKKWKRRFLGAAASIPLRESIRARINYHPFVISRLWNVNAQEIDKFKNESRVKLIYFESLLRNPEKEIRELCDFLEITFEPIMLQVEKKGSSIEGDTHEAKIDSTKIGGWKKGLNSTEVFICEKLTNHWRSVFNYPDTKIKGNFLMYILYAVIFPVQMFFALILNLGRSKNILQSIKKRFF